jgi:hypothetical protein
VTATEQADHDLIDHGFLANDDLAQLVEDPPSRLVKSFGIGLAEWFFAGRLVLACIDW